MAFSKHSKVILSLYVLSCCLYSFCKCEDNGFEINLIHGKLVTPFFGDFHYTTNTITLLRYVSYNYQLRGLISETLKIFGAQNGSATSSQAAEKCNDDLLLFLSNPHSLWAMQMLDSNGKIPSGLIKGSIEWHGHYSQCINTYAPVDENGHGDFRGQYCAFSWTQNIDKKYDIYPLTIGLCIPDSCSEENIKTLIRNASHVLDQFESLKILKTTFTFHNVVCKDGNKPLDGPAIIYLCIVFIFLALTIMGSVLTCLDSWKIHGETNIKRTVITEDNVIALYEKDIVNKLNAKLGEKEQSEYKLITEENASVENILNTMVEDKISTENKQNLSLEEDSFSENALNAKVKDGTSLECISNEDIEENSITEDKLNSKLEEKTYGKEALNAQVDDIPEDNLDARLKEKENINGNSDISDLSTSTRDRAHVWKRILLCFCIFSNGEKILSTKSTKGQILSINAIRTFCMTWIVLGHAYMYIMPVVANKTDVVKEFETFAFQPLLHTNISVDIFTLLSGFLLAYLFLKGATKKNGKINWTLFYFHRIWRLTPLYLIVVYFYMLIYKHVGSGPYWNDNECDGKRDTWWMYILYINNFIPQTQTCVGWVWYIANDMQLYVISPFILYPLWKWPKFGLILLGCIFFASCTITGIMSYSYEFIPLMYKVADVQDSATYENKTRNFFDLVYSKPYYRISSYIVGILLGYVLYKNGGRKHFLTRWQQFSGWTIAFICLFGVIYYTYYIDLTRATAAVYIAISRPICLIGIMWIIYACETGHGGFLSEFLSWKWFIPLSRLTFGVFLVNEMYLRGFYLSQQKALHYTRTFMFVNYLNYLAISFGLAFILSMIFEAPFMNLEKLLVKRKRE